jgi:excisionase family DNA binding protein
MNTRRTLGASVGSSIGRDPRTAERDKDWLTTREVAEILGLSCATVLRRHARGDLPGGRRLWGHTLRFSRVELEAWLAAQA